MDTLMNSINVCKILVIPLLDMCMMMNQNTSISAALIFGLTIVERERETEQYFIEVKHLWVNNFQQFRFCQRFDIFDFLNYE